MAPNLDHFGRNDIITMFLIPNRAWPSRQEVEIEMYQDIYQREVVSLDGPHRRHYALWLKEMRMP